MLRFEVLKNNTPAGFVEAMTSEAAIEKLYAQGWELRDTLTLRRNYGDGMYLLADLTNSRALAVHDSYKALAALAVIQFANVDTAIVRLGQNRTFAVFSHEQLIGVGASLGITINKKAGLTDKIKAIREAVEGNAWLQLPFTTEQLEEQAYAISYLDDKPYGFDPESKDGGPKPLPKWPSEPQVGRKRIDSSFWHCFSAGPAYVERRMDDSPEKARQPAAKGAPKAPAAPKPPKPPKAPSAPAVRPKEGTATGKVWDICDAAYKAAGEVQDWKAFRAAVTALAEKEGINAGTVGVQFGKWKSSISL